jgi:hypothetical protein
MKESEYMQYASIPHPPGTPVVILQKPAILAGERKMIRRNIL